MASVVRSRVQQEEAASLLAPLPLPADTAAIDAVWARDGGGDAMGPWVDRLLGAALRGTEMSVARLEGGRDAVRYVLEIAGDRVAAGPDGAVVLPGRRAAVMLTVGPGGAQALADTWCPGLSLGLSSPAEDPVVSLLRRPGGDVILASTPALPAAARGLIDQLPEAPRPPPSPPPPPHEATAPVDDRPSGMAMIVGLAALSLVAIGIAGLHALTDGTPQPATGAAVIAPPAAAVPRPSPRFVVSGPPVANGVIAADPTTGDLVLIGCCDDNGISGATVSTWAWDGRSWTHLGVRGNAPPFQRGLHLAYDDATHAFVLQGGQAQTGTWILAGGSWADAQPGLQPPLGATSMVYDPAMKQVVLVVPDPGDQLAQTWAWDGTWTEIASAGPSLNNPAALAYDPATQQLVLAGQDGFGTQVTVWTFTSVRTWRHDSVVAGFAYDATMQLSWDGVSRRLIAVSLGPDAIPANGSTLPVDTWAWDGRAWSQLPTAGAPTEPGLLASSANHGVLFVGIDETAGVPRVWAWTGTNWAPLRSPPPAGDGLGGITPATTALPARVP